MTVAPRCPHPSQLQQLLLGHLSEEAAARLEQHLGRCPRCDRLLLELRAEDDLVAAMRSGTTPPLRPADLDALRGLLPRLHRLRPARQGTVMANRSAGTPSVAPFDPSEFLRPPQAPDEIGRLGGYRVLQMLGQGGMGIVFRAEDLQLQRPVALKVMRPNLARKALARERFLREARATAQVEHENVVAIHAVGEDNGVPFLVMQLLEGTSLEALLRRQEQERPGTTLTLPQILKLGREIARGLAVAHKRGLIHRDVKPANVWLDSSACGRVKILDFGLVLAVEGSGPAPAGGRLTQLGTFLGTPAYVAPEQGWGDGRIDGRADLFSLGCILYRLCTGRVPWKGQSAMDTLVSVALEEPPSLAESDPELPPRFARLVTQLLARKPEDRPASADAVVETIQAIERELEARRTQPPAASPVPPSAGRQAPEPPCPTSVSASARPTKSRRAPADPRPILRPPPRSKPTPRWGVALALCSLVAVVLVGATAGLFALASRKPDKLAQAEKAKPPAEAPKDEPPVPPRPSADGVITNSIGLKLAPIPPGKFLMGSSDEQLARIAREPLRGYAYPDTEKDERPRHEVRITRGFYLGVYEVTQGQYERVMGGNPSANKQSPEHPVERVRWIDAAEFCRRLSELPEERKAGRTYRLPTDAEWEYCCRAGTTTLFHYGDALSSRQANIDGNNPFAAEKAPKIGKTVKVGSYKPNAWGIYDMHGNVWEWCQDGSRKYGPGPVDDPRGAEGPDDFRMLRGGSWNEGAVRSAFHKARPAVAYRGGHAGFRVACFVTKDGR